MISAELINWPVVLMQYQLNSENENSVDFFRRNNINFEFLTESPL